MQRWLVSIILIAALLGVGFGIQNWLVATAPQPARNEEARPPLRVDGFVLRPTTRSEPLIGFGTVASQRTALVSAQVGGEVILRARELRVGTEVAEGTVLLQLDRRDYERQLDRANSQVNAQLATIAQIDQEQHNVERLLGIAESELAIAEREYTRVLNLFERTQAAQRELDIARQTLEGARRTVQSLENTRDLLGPRRNAAEAARDLAQADVELAKLSLERCTIKAPFDGRIESVLVEAGERINPAQALFAILDPDDLEIPLELSVSQRDRVQVGTTCRITTEARTDIVWQGRIARIAPSARPETRTFSAFLDIDNADMDQPLLPGMFVRAELKGPILENVLVVPRGSIVDGKVYTADDGKARANNVEIQQHLKAESVILGIQPGNVVIVSNLDVLFDGCPIEVHEIDAQSDATQQAVGTEIASEPQRGT